MQIAARLYPDADHARNDPSDGERVHILQFLFEVDTGIDKHRPIPVAIIKDNKGLLSSVRINRLRVN